LFLNNSHKIDDYSILFFLNGGKMQISNSEFREEIITYIESKGRIKATLLHKLENQFCKSGMKVSRDFLISHLFSMLKERIIEIIIPEPLKVKWKKKEFKNLEFLKDGFYYERLFLNLRNKSLRPFKLNDYYFDSRFLNFQDKELIEEAIEHLTLLINRVKEINKVIIIFIPYNTDSLNIYEKFSGNYKINLSDFQVPSQSLKEPKLEVSVEQQSSALAIIQAYRSRFMCFYITLIEAIQKTIINIQKNKALPNYTELMEDYAKKFAYNCIMFVLSDYVELYEANPYRWETFFVRFKIPIHILIYDFLSIKFYGKTFDNYQQLKFFIYIDKSYDKQIEKLKELGYCEFSDKNHENKVAIGLDQIIYYPCCSIEQIYFVSKYICFYHLFKLFYHSFEYLKKSMNLKLLEREGLLFENFKPVMRDLFGVKGQKVSNELIFKYYTYNPIELEVIYNKILLQQVKIIEPKLMKYFLVRCNNKTI